MQILPLLLLEQTLRGLHVDSLACIRDLERPFDVVLVEAQVVDHVGDGAVNGVLDLWAERGWCEGWVEGWAAWKGERD